MNYTHHYLIHLQYLGYRYHGWMVQKELKTVQYMVEKTCQFVLGHERFKTLGSSRTDALVSAEHSVFELFLQQELDMEEFLKDFDHNLPPDIHALDIEQTDRHFNIIQTPKTKEYHYLFSFGEKPHPFSAPFMAYHKRDLDIEVMMEGARLFEGRHNMKMYCTKPKPGTEFEREITHCAIAENKQYTASFFPEHSYMLTIRSKGFLRYQVRLIMAQLFKLGEGRCTLEEIAQSLRDPGTMTMDSIAPASGLVLSKVQF